MPGRAAAGGRLRQRVEFTVLFELAAEEGGPEGSAEADPVRREVCRRGDCAPCSGEYDERGPSFHIHRGSILDPRCC